MKITWKEIAMIAAIIALVALATWGNYTVHAIRTPDAPVWTRFF